MAKIPALKSLIASQDSPNSRRDLWVPSDNPGWYEVQVWVVAVSDGDTVDVIFGGETEARRVRLGGIGAPEMDQPFGPECKSLLETLALGKNLMLDVVCTGSVEDCPGGDACVCVDYFGRIVGNLHDGDWRNSINKQLGEVGMAYNMPTHGLLYGATNAEKRTRSKRISIWGKWGGEVCPWSHRRAGTQTPMEFMEPKEEEEARGADIEARIKAALGGQA